MTRINIGAKLLLNNLNWILKAERTTIGGIDEIKEKIRLRVWNNTEDHTKGMNGDKMDMNDILNPEEESRNKNIGLYKIGKNAKGRAPQSWK
jgi:hypothetical protein